MSLSFDFDVPLVKTCCCGVFSLSKGVIIIAVLDILGAASCLLLGIAVFLMPEKWEGHATAHIVLYNERSALAIVAMMIVALISIFFAVLGIKGVRSLSEQPLRMYFLWKLGRFCFYTLLMVSELFRSMDILGSTIVFTTFRMYMLWVVWSFYQSLTSGVASSELDGIEGEERRPLSMSAGKVIPSSGAI